MAEGPFFGQVNNAVGALPDQLKVSFQCTQSVMNAQGKILTAIYYDDPNSTFSMDVNGTYNATAATLTAD